MKIDETSNPYLLDPRQVQKTEDRPTANGFRDVLNTHLSEETQKGTLPLPPLQGPRGVLPPSCQPDFRDAIHCAEQLLDSVAVFGQQLADVGTSLRTMAPTVQRMKEEVAIMEQHLQRMPDDSPVRQVIEDARALVDQEVRRYDGGYYVDP